MARRGALRIFLIAPAFHGRQKRTATPGLDDAEGVKNTQRKSSDSARVGLLRHDA